MICSAVLGTECHFHLSGCYTVSNRYRFPLDHKCLLKCLNYCKRSHVNYTSLDYTTLQYLCCTHNNDTFIFSCMYRKKSLIN